MPDDTEERLSDHEERVESDVAYLIRQALMDGAKVDSNQLAAQILRLPKIHDALVIHVLMSAMMEVLGFDHAELVRLFKKLPRDETETP